MSDLLQQLVSISALAASVGVAIFSLALRVTTRRMDDRIRLALSAERATGRHDMLGAEETVLRALLAEGDASVPELSVATRLTPREVQSALRRLDELNAVTNSRESTATIWAPASSPAPRVHWASIRLTGHKLAAVDHAHDEIDDEIDAALARLRA
jgi:hypothetical protein